MTYVVPEQGLAIDIFDTNDITMAERDDVTQFSELFRQQAECDDTGKLPLRIIDTTRKSNDLFARQVAYTRFKWIDVEFGGA